MLDLTSFVIAGLCTGAIYVLSGVGLVVLYRAAGVLNFAQGALGALAALVAWTIIDIGEPIWLAWAAGIASASLVSLAYGWLIAPRLAHSEPIVRATATLGLLLLVLGVVEYVWGETPRSLHLPTDTLGFRVFDVRVTYTRAIALALSVTLTSGIAVFLRRTRLGLSMRALSNDREISALIGVRVVRVTAWAWAISGAIAGLSGLLLADLVRLQAIPLTFIVIPAMAAAIAARLRSLSVTVAAGLTIGVLEAVGTPFSYIAPLRSAAPFVFAMLALLWMQRRPGELFSPRPAVTTFAPSNSAQPVWRQFMPSACFVLLATLLPLVVSAYWLKNFTDVAIFSLASLSVGILYAQLGMVSLAQYALLGVGGWFALRVSHASGLPFEGALVVGGVSASLLGILISLPALRMRGLYFALVTLMIAGAAQIVLSATGFPDGGPGLSGRVVSGARIFMQRPSLAVSDSAYFRYTLLWVAGCFLFVRWHRLSRAGRAWAQIRRSDVCALSAGVNIVAYKVWAFALAGFLAGIAGGLMAGSVGQLDGRAFPASDSIMLFALTVIAGSDHWFGAVVAALLLRAVPALLTDWGIDGNIASMIFGAGLLHALISSPAGISGQLLGLQQRLMRCSWMASVLRTSNGGQAK